MFKKKTRMKEVQQRDLEEISDIRERLLRQPMDWRPGTTPPGWVDHEGVVQPFSPFPESKDANNE